MLLPWLFPQTKRNNFAAKVNSENQEKLLILRKEDASASSGQSELSLVQMIKAGSRQQLLAGIRVPALQGGLQRRPEVPSEWNRQRAAPAVRHLPEP